MGEVHLARHSSGRIVAIKHVRKTLSLDPLLCERLAEEARILSRLDHPNVVNVLEGGTDREGRPYLVMERAFGTPLDVVIAESSPFTRERITGVMSQLLAGVISIHEAGVIHADLKSSNVLIDELDRVTIIDFGLACLAPCDELQHEIFGGTPAYMAPEVLSGGVPSIAADIFAAGIIAYELLTGATPLAGTLPAMVLLNLRLHEPVERPSVRAPERAITQALDDVLVCALDRDPEARFATVRDFADAFAVALADWEPAFDDIPTVHKVVTPSPANLAPTLVLAPTTESATLVRPATEEQIITRALDAASALVAERDVKAAVATLELALTRLAPVDPASPIVPDVWRIQTVIAALYQSLGMKDHANRLARLAIQHAHRTDSPIARARAIAVMTQITADQNRIARGSRQVPLRTRKR
ncbi:hypothetical protein BH11MYX1_BH11MYX1_02410 [soil metagenome]